MGLADLNGLGFRCISTQWYNTVFKCTTGILGSSDLFSLDRNRASEDSTSSSSSRNSFNVRIYYSGTIAIAVSLFAIRFYLVSSPCFHERLSWCGPLCSFHANRLCGVCVFSINLVRCDYDVVEFTFLM